MNKRKQVPYKLYKTHSFWNKSNGLGEENYVFCTHTDGCKIIYRISLTNMN